MRWTLTELGARWMQTSRRRYGVGVVFTCPVCPKEERCELRLAFLKPDDGEGPVSFVPGGAFYSHRGGSLDNLTIREVIWHRGTGLVLRDGRVYGIPLLDG